MGNDALVDTVVAVEWKPFVNEHLEYSGTKLQRLLNFDYPPFTLMALIN